MLSYWIPVILLILAVLAFSGSVIWMKKYAVLNVANQADCIGPDSQKKNCGNDAGCCLIWDNGTCRKGKLDSSGNCASKAELGPLISAVVGAMLLVASIVTLIMAIFQHKR